MFSRKRRVNSPHKCFTRKFLHQLVQNNFVSPKGYEYDPDEVMEMLVEKETRLRAGEFRRALEELKHTPIDHVAAIKDYQDLVCYLLKARDARRSS